VLLPRIIAKRGGRRHDAQELTSPSATAVRYLGAVNPPASNPVSIARVAPLTDRSALELAASAWPQAERPAYWQAIHDLAGTGRGERVVLLAARQNDALLAAQVAQSLPGRAAAVWPPQFSPHANLNSKLIAQQLFDRLLPELAATGAHIAQALVAIGDHDSQRLFSLGGFTAAAELLYLAADVKPPVAQPAELPFELESFTPAAESRLIRLIERTYVGTLDCPQIDGLRETADVVAGYKSIGQFRPERWLIARCGGDDIGCLLVNVHPDVNHAEIVYVALVPEMRGRNWGLLLVQHAHRLAAGADCERVVLAVDAANQPAIGLYAAADFFQFDRRLVWIRSLASQPQHIGSKALACDGRRQR
jgi:ribosomal protein S18 acetylase RimI-like enzyme